MATENQMELLTRGSNEFLKDVQQQVLKQKFHCEAIGEQVTYDGCAYGEIRECPHVSTCKINDIDLDLLNLSLCIRSCA